MPSQSRSGATVEALHEATVQVLLAEGLNRLTTTRVAERAGVSVGTLYQYYPNKQALLFAILARHFEEMAEALERIGIDGPAETLDDLAHRIADAYVSAKLAHPDTTVALYRVAGAIDQVRLPSDVFKKLDAAVVRLLTCVPDASFSDPHRVAFTLLSALAGVSRGSFGALASGRHVQDSLREETRLLSRAYLRAAAETELTMK
ncbi:TetR/AcrR family transcriptional regulator [Acuticoccus sediminis]|uniref:TetR/AcrR family transcriptional regulator n=2 Tax=Acuticoccus sediminis TaxID=2184697 RepID=A0A8B2NUQ8_9HYPH|nr:TetR/AcrR family transcriptional regulator [Acuticoccus sediminis]